MFTPRMDRGTDTEERMEYRETIERAEALEEAAILLSEDAEEAFEQGDLDRAEALAENVLLLIQSARAMRMGPNPA